MELYQEYALQTHQRAGVFVPCSSVPALYEREDAGYCSLYKFRKDAVDEIRKQKNSSGLSRFSVYADRLWIDIDRDDVAVARDYAMGVVKPRLDEMGLQYSIWESGGKGFHFCIVIEPMEGIDVPYSQMMWVKEQGFECDYSLYQHGRLFSNPGRKHAKTGVRKNCVLRVQGSVLQIPMLPQPKKAPAPTGLQQADLARLGLSRLGGIIQDAPLPGMRHSALWSLAGALFEAGMDRSLVLSNLLFVNQFFPSPKPRDEIERAIDQAKHQLDNK